MYWQRVTIEQPTNTQTGTGNVRQTWSTYAELEARVLPIVVDEEARAWATVEEQAFEVHLRHALDDIIPGMRVVHDGVYYDIRRVATPPPFGTPTTVLHVVKEVP